VYSHETSLMSCYSGTSKSIKSFRLRAFHPLWSSFPSASSRSCSTLTESYNPLGNQGFGLVHFRSPLLMESLSLSTPLVNEMFHFTRFHSGRQRRRGRGHRPLGYPIRGPTGCNVFAVNRGLSQLIAPFIVFRHQGIHHQPLMTFV
jgi:hypothetical protein